MLKSQQRLRGKKHSISTKDKNIIALSANNDKITQLMNYIEIYAPETN